MFTKVLLLHGPISSVGINLVSQNLVPGPGESRQTFSQAFDCRANIIALSMAFRRLGYKVGYSGWNEDREWLEANSQLFDCMAISDQTNLKSEDMVGATVLQNNKDKLFFSVAEGLSEVERHFGCDALVMRLRSDSTVNPRLVEDEMVLAQARPGGMRIEYLDGGNLLWVPDFMMIARVGIMHAMYQEMFQRSVNHKGYHVSSHIDISLTLIGMLQSGRLTAVECMSRALFDSLIWRGIPRYVEQVLYPLNKPFAFSCTLNVPPEFDLQAQIDKFKPIMESAYANQTAGKAAG